MLELKNVSVSARDEDFEIINDVNLSLKEKKLYVVTGPNGGGKTTLAKAIMGIYPISGGELLLDGEDITNCTISERATKGIGYAFQAPPRFKGLHVRDLLSIATWGGHPRTETTHEQDEEKLFTLLSDVGLNAKDYIDRELNASFSGGELKRVEIASILAKDLKIALFDEPEAGIDLWSFQKLTETFKNLNEISNTTIVIISHQERILQIANKVVVVANGMIDAVGSRDEILPDLLREARSCNYHKEVF